MNHEMQVQTALDALKAELDVVVLEDRLEMVALGSVAVSLAAESGGVPPGGNGMCCCS